MNKTAKPRSAWPKIILIIILAFFVLVVLWLMPAAAALTRWFAWPKTPTQSWNLLIAGVDAVYTGYHQRAPENFTGRTDTLVLANFSSRGISLLSIPRDTRIFLKNYGYSKINSANPRGGPDLTVQAVENLTDAKIDAYLFISFDAARQIVDAMGGIDLNVPSQMRYVDTAAGLNIDLKPGQQHLNGQQAEGFLRYRADGLGDIGRVGRQQIFLEALVHQLANPLTFIRLPQILATFDHQTKTNLQNQQVAEIFGSVLNKSQVKIYTVPGQANRIGGVSYWLADQRKLSPLIAQSFR